MTTFRKETEDGDEMELHSFEVAALMNLVATDMSVEEATALIPSLSRFPEAAIDEILDLVGVLRICCVLEAFILHLLSRGAAHIHRHDASLD